MLIKISILVNEVFPGWSPDSERLGGTEKSVVRWAQELTKKGYSVTVFHNGNHGVYDGVTYVDRSEYEPGDLTLNIKSLDRSDGFYLTNETNASNLDLSAYKGVIWPSQWTTDNIPVNNKTFILPHGYDPIPKQKKIKNQCLYSSSPDRGLDNLKDLWPRVVENIPDAQLIVTYNGNLDLPNTTCLGEVDEEMMNDLYATSEFWLHPANGGELFCMSGINAQVAGAIPVYYPIMALQETVKHGIKCTPESFVWNLVEAMNDTKLCDTIRDELSKEHYIDWEESTDMLLEILNG